MGYPSIDSVLKEMREHKADLLRVLERPEVPLHNNGEETDMRDYVKKRKISGGARSDDGRRCRDTQHQEDLPETGYQLLELPAGSCP